MILVRGDEDPLCIEDKYKIWMNIYVMLKEEYLGGEQERGTAVSGGVCSALLNPN